MSVRYCGRDFSDEEIANIQHLIEEDPARTRADISRLACQAMGWFKPDGGLNEMSARVAMLRMQADGLITLPPPRCSPPDSRVRITSASDPWPTIQGASIKRLNGRVFIPTSIFKAVYSPKRQAAGVYLTNNAPGDDWRTISLSELREMTGLDVFPSLPQAVKDHAMPLPDPGSKSHHHKDK